MEKVNPYKLVLEVAAKSPCHNRKVGAVLLDKAGGVAGVGWNHAINGGPCEDASGATEENVIHAEQAAIKNYFANPTMLPPVKMLITHNPCASCIAAIASAFGADFKIEVVGAFMKFDSDKLRYDLIPNEWHKGDAEILTFGAKKYKPNNWRNVEDAGRYIAALERHLSAFKQAIENGDSDMLLDKDSGLHHLKHLRTNAGFLLTLTECENTYEANRDNGLFTNLESSNEH